MRELNIRRITLTALMAALIFVLTLLPRVPVAVGYVHLGDVGITFSALAFGPLVGAVSGGLGTALADVAGGYVQFALISFVVHGLQGWVMGFITRRKVTTSSGVVAVIAGTIVLVAGYFVGEVLFIAEGQAASEIVPNILQGLVGGLIGVPLYFATRKAYPPLIYRGEREP
jgi:uncharacterized membrane protein